MSIEEQTARVAGFIPTSATDGPGIRSVLFLQGCSRKCQGCHNPKLQDSNGGYQISIVDLVQYVTTNCRNKKLTVSGGEPLEQLPELDALLRQLQKTEFDVCLYTSCEVDDVPSTVKEKLHYLKTGSFQRKLVYPPKPFVGSNNQAFYEVKHRKDGTTWLVEI